MNYRNYNDYELIYNVHEKDDGAWDILYEKYQPIIHSLASEYYKLYSNYGFDYDDFVQEGNIAFQRALMYYDEEKNSIFYSFVVLCVRRKLITFCRRISGNGKNVPNNEILDVDECVITDSIDSVSSFIDFQELEMIFKKVLYDLSFDKSSIFELKLNGFTYNEIAVLLDIPSSTAEFKNRSARRKLQQSLQNYYYN